MRQSLALSCVVASVCAVSVLAPATAPVAAAAASPAGFLPAPTIRTFEIDGRTITLEATVLRVIPGAPIKGGQSRTQVSVNIRVNDGALLPEDLRVVGVRFEKLRGVNRFFFTPTSETSDGGGGFEEHARGYTGDLSERASVRYLKAVVRLERDGEVIKVPMGTMEVFQDALP